ncbi:hypothetical protein JTE90_012432 [Oedothorax gibbosus]|uniref:Uncharacterized protein n=1 Tax=Oedothorax gibbosus TaxID=931172 RepID=A0AAV6TDD6_9ARAC|nr:hypothetical protein JTE90_012432 [Oedothorax gibbosus]
MFGHPFRHVGSTKAKSTANPKYHIKDSSVIADGRCGHGPGTNQREMMTLRLLENSSFMAGGYCNRNPQHERGSTGLPHPVGKGKHTMIPSMWQACVQDI